MVGLRLKYLPRMAALLLLAAILAACGTDTADPEGTPDTSTPGGDSTPAPGGDGTPDAGGDSGVSADTPLSLTYVFPSNVPERGFYAWTIADHLGFFEDENLDIEFVNSGGSGAAIQQIIAGQAQAGMPHASAVLEAYNSGEENLRYIYTYTTTGTFGLFAKSDSGIESVEDIEAGMTIGVTAIEGGEVAILRAVLEDLGLTLDQDVQMIAIGEGGPATFQAVSGGQVDAFAMSYTDVAVLTDTAAGQMEITELTPEEFLLFPAHGMSTLQEHVDDPEMREAFIRLGRGVAKATLFCQTNFEACIQITSELIPELFSENENLQRTIMSRSELITAIEEGRQLGEHRPEAWKSFVEFQVETNPDWTMQPEEIDNLLITDFVDEYNDFDQEAIIQMAEDWPTS